MELTARSSTLRLAETFTISRESRGRGRGRPGRDRARRRQPASARPRRSSATTSRPQSALAFLEEHGELLGDDPFALEEIDARLAERPGEQAAKAALDAALHDLCGKLPGVPVWRLLGLPRRGPADVAGRLARRPRRHGAAGGARRRPLPAPEAEARRRATGSTSSACARSAASPTCRSRWTSTSTGRSSEALDALPQLAELGVEYCEQPLPGGRPRRAAS